ncbi:MAG: isoleucine--tRNA ligase [Candidatus Diapherotrites archaeon]|uniref:Isoleucine--tRNA ligase n=1 Tax=Candidatus Iainarchaeum sp. TaxID=3101447 RepID=A0A2D6LPQ3_9ARCH|nr:isoleucine--tRNA ligase [Candidatus Diapherotrites archaeon]
MGQRLFATYFAEKVRIMKKLEQYTLEKEEEIRKQWKKNNTVEKARTQNAKGKGFFMMDGPPYASGHIHMGTALNKIVKDITMRHKRMQGFSVLDQPGYDTHGLPIENKVEKELGLKTKADIEKYGIEKFIEKCRTFATQYIGIMNDEFDNLGVWMDWNKPYLTLNNEYIEAIWWTFKKADEKGLLYLGKYPIHACTHCETAVAYNEIEYTKQTDTSIYVKFKLKGKENKYLIIWTTTPWTLPSNTGIMINPKYDYVEAEVMGETWIIAKERLQQLMDAAEAGYTVKREFKGKELEGTEYENPLAKHLKLEEVKNGYRVIMSERYVNLEEGTGLVHTAPGCGKEDYEEGTKAGLPVVSIVNVNGLFTEEGGKYAGKKARVVDTEIIKDLEEDNALVYRHPYTHDYPICWRCKSSLLMISAPQWFFKVTDIRKKMLKLNEGVNWYPSWGQDRFKNWLDSLGDWPISRQRYWGTPLPIWLCDSCETRTVISSQKELKKHYKGKIKDLHKPWIDKVEWKCKCKGNVKRVSEVMDVWFDSGVASWGSIGYPEDKKKFEKYWPADFNVEGKDQIRGWWNSQLITSTICFDKAPFKDIAMHGMVLDLSKNKMSKSQGNIVSPQEVIKKYNRDYLRFYIAQEFKGEDMTFEWDSFKDINRFFNVLWNSFNYGATYLELDLKKHEKVDQKKLQAEDKWIISKMHSLSKEVLDHYNTYNYSKAVSLIEYFVLEEFSRTYIKMVRPRVKNDDKAVSVVFSHVFSELIRLLAPIVPHLSEYFYQHAKTKGMPESVHLTKLPNGNKEYINKKLEAEVQKVKELTQETLSLREQEKLRLRWPLEELIYVGKKKEFSNTLEIIASQTNVKKFSEGKEPKGNFASKEFGEGKIFLNLDASPELKEEWELMELRRKIQDMRKQLKLNPVDKVKMLLNSSDPDFVEKYKKEIEESTNTKIVDGKGKTEKLLEREFFIELKK